VVAYHSAFRLPPLMEPHYWRYAAVLFVGYLIVIGVFFFIKRLFLRGE
jgi:ABC-type glycerol-3-phosphate transport system permease component